MRERVRDAFDQITADEKLKEQTKAFLAQKRRKAPVRRPVRRMAAVLVCMMCLLLGVGSWSYLTPTSAISIESAAALELDVNRFDRVIAVRGTDEAGCALAQTLEVNHMPYLNALQIVLDAQEADEEGVSIGVAGEDEVRCQAMMREVEDCTAARQQVHCYTADAETLEDARESGLPLGKYRMLLTLQELDPTLTAEDVQGMRMSELRRMEAQLSGTDTTDPGNGQGAQNGANGRGNGQNQSGTGQNGAGNGAGNGMGNGMGSGQGNGAKRGQNAG